MQKNLRLWQFGGYVVATFLGTLLHFLYDWTNLPFFALFSAVNESTWEHMKILFLPMFFVAVVTWAITGKTYENFWCVKARGILLATILIPVLFYTYKGVFGEPPAVVNILIFFLSAGIATVYETKFFLEEDTACKSPILAFSILCLVAVCFFVFTFFPPRIPLLLDPLFGDYGI